MLSIVNSFDADLMQNYKCMVTNKARTATSSMVAMTVIPVPAVIPCSQVVLAGNPFSFWELNEDEPSSWLVSRCKRNKELSMSRSAGL